MDALVHFNPQGPRGPRRSGEDGPATISYFNPQGPRGPRLLYYASTGGKYLISIHKALAGLDYLALHSFLFSPNFNPQGPRGPRLFKIKISYKLTVISIHKALAGLDLSASLLTVSAG